MPALAEQVNSCSTRMSCLSLFDSSNDNDWPCGQFTNNIFSMSGASLDFNGDYYCYGTSNYRPAFFRVDERGGSASVYGSHTQPHATSKSLVHMGTQWKLAEGSLFSDPYSVNARHVLTDSDGTFRNLMAAVPASWSSTGMGTLTCIPIKHPARSPPVPTHYSPGGDSC